MRRRLLLPAFTVAAFFLFVVRKVPRSVHHGTSAAATIAYRELYGRTFHNENDSRLSLETVIWTKNWKRLMNCAVPLPEGYGDNTETIFSGSALQASLTSCRGYIFVPSTSLQKNNNVDKFIRHVLPHLTEAFVLITADGDNGFPTRGVWKPKHALQLLHHPLLLRWYTQNYDGTIQHPKLFPIPIGLDLHTPHDGVRWDTPEAFTQLLAERQAAVSQQQQRNPTPFLPLWTVRSRHPDRRRLGQRLRFCRVPHTPQTSWGTIAQVHHNFTAHVAGFSPHGNGLDCHRTFEMLW